MRRHHRSFAQSLIAAEQPSLLALGKNGRIYRVTITGDYLTYRNLHEKGAFTTLAVFNDDLLAIGKNEKVYRVTITGDNLTYRNLQGKKGAFTTLAMFNDDLLLLVKMERYTGSLSIATISPIETCMKKKENLQPYWHINE